MNMEQITKKNFKEIITEHDSAMVANFRKSHFDFAELEQLLLYNMDTVNYLMYNELRSAEANGKYIVFSNESRLDINDNQYNKYETYIYRFTFGTVLASECKWYDSCDDEWNYQTIYYMLK